jgi:hypothetical protein
MAQAFLYPSDALFLATSDFSDKPGGIKSTDESFFNQPIIDKKFTTISKIQTNFKNLFDASKDSQVEANFL